MQFAIVTGAANGLGKAFALELSKRKFNTILIDLPGKFLPQLCQEIKKHHGTESICYETDLMQKENVVQLANFINSNYDVFMLVNNAGVGGSRRFDEATLDYINGIIQLNVMATSLLTHQILPNLRRQDSKAYILNVSSMAAFSPMGYKTVYPASKVFVHNFTRGLYQELKHTNVFVSVVNPGPMKTNKEVTERINKLGFFGKLGLLSPESVARISIRQLLKRDTMIMTGFANGLNWLLMKTIPIYIRLPLLTNAMKKDAYSHKI